MANKYVNAEKLSIIIKKLFKKLMDKGTSLVDIHDFNVELHRILDKMPAAAAVEWCDANIERPLVSDEYIVKIMYADKPTVLHYDADEDVWYTEYDGEEIRYRVTHWAELPEAPHV